MSADLKSFQAGQIVLVDWRDALPKEPNKRRPAVVVEDNGLFAPNHASVILVPLTADGALVIADLATLIEPTAENGCPKSCWAAAHLVTAASKRRVTGTGSKIEPAQLAAIRRQVAFAIGFEG